jgi:arylformamidase
LKIIDLSHEIYHGMPTMPLDPKTGVLVHHTLKSMKYNISQLIMSTHLGTHLDAPFHFYEDGLTVDKLDLQKCIGPAKIIKLSGKGSNSEITIKDLKKYEDYFHPESKVILNLGWYKLFPKEKYFLEMPGITVDCANWIRDRKIGMIGLDTPGVHPRDWEEVHKIFLGSEIVIVEGLNNLDEISSEEIFFVGLPLKIKERDGSPIRAVAIEGL